MKKYVLNTAALTIASLMAADATLATDAYLQNLFGDMKTVTNATVEADGDIDLNPVGGGGAVDSEAVKQILGTGSAVGTANLVDATTVSNRLLTAPLAVGYDAFNFAGGALPAGETITARENALGVKMVAAFAAGANLETAGVTVVGTALGVGTVGVPADLLGAAGYSKAILDATAADVGEASRNIHDVIGGAALPTDAITNADTVRDGMAVNTAAPFVSVTDAYTALNASIGAGVALAPIAGKPLLTRLTGVDDADNAGNPRLAGSLSGMLSILPANDVLAQAEARRAALVAMAQAFYAAGVYGDVATAGNVVGPHDAAGAGVNAHVHYQAINASPATASIELVIKAFLNQA